MTTHDVMADNLLADTGPNTALILPLASKPADAVRRRFDAMQAVGMPLHITLMTPFFTPDTITPEVEDALQASCPAEPFSLRFTRLIRRDATAALVAEPNPGLDALSSALKDRFEFPVGHQVTAEATVADGLPEALGTAEAEVGPHLPMDLPVRAMHLVVRDGRRWHLARRFAFRP